MPPAFLRAGLAGLLAMSSLGTAMAGTSTGTLGVRVIVQPNCTVSSATLDFGTYVSGQAAASAASPARTVSNTVARASSNGSCAT